MYGASGATTAGFASTARDRVAFLQALVSNDVAALVAAAVLYATYLTPQGRMVADLHIYHRGDSSPRRRRAGARGGAGRALDGLIFTRGCHASPM